MTKEKRHIIVPIDFSEQSTIALSQTYNLARMSSADITLLHVIDEALFSSVLHLFSSKEDQEELLRLGIQTKLNGMANDAKAKSGLEFNTRIEKGKIYDVVAEVAKEINASFIVMGTSGETTLKKKFIGSNAIRVISDAPCPVITIKGKKHRSGCNTILLPLDLSKETKEKVTQCIEIARFFNSTVKVMSVIDTEDEFLINKLERQMDQVVAFIAGHEIACTGEFYKHKDISEGVLEYSDKINADLIIIMTQKESDWTVFVSTESQQIINNSEVPICSIRPIERKDTTEYVIT
ncbi:MAG: universal stress protein [Bacteroidetes bacterium]|nr:universal stress protein [Bacteroidota bacterium]